MKSRSWVAIASVLFLGLSAAPATALSTSDYIVTLHNDAGLSDARLSGKKLHDRWTSALNAVRVSLTTDEAHALRTNPNVAAVEVNRKRRIEATQSISANHNVDNWALDALQGGAPAMDGEYSYNSDGSGVTVVVVDTGVFPNSDIGDRLKISKNFVDGAGGSGSAKDCNGHGTHVASIAAGTRFGVAKAASIYNLRVLDCWGSGWDSDIVDALDWLNSHKPTGRSVVNMSIGGGGAYDITAAVDRLVAGGVSVAVAAGNESSDACDGMIVPKSGTNLPTPGVVTVGAYASDSSVSWFSNYGECVDLFAPGSAILSRTIAIDPYTEDPLVDPNTNDFIPVNEAWSGTSMATPVVVGAIARYLQANSNATPAQVETALVTNALEDALDYSGSDAWNWDETLGNSANRMLDYSSIEMPSAAASISAPNDLTYGQSAAYTITSSYSNSPSTAVQGPCHISDGRVFADYGVGTCTLSATFAAEGSYSARTISADVRLKLAQASVANPITEAGWNSAFVLPQRQTLALSVAPTKITGGCKVSRLVLTASSSSGNCYLAYNAFNDGYYSYPKSSVTVKLGTPTQSWSSKVTKAGIIRYSSRAVQLAAKLTPLTSYGFVGTWSVVSGPCTLDLSSARNGAMVNHAGVKGQSCVVTLSAPSAFKLPGLTSSWTINK